MSTSGNRLGGGYRLWLIARRHWKMARHIATEIGVQDFTRYYYWFGGTISMLQRFGGVEEIKALMADIQDKSIEDVSFGDTTRATLACAAHMAWMERCGEQGD